MKLGLLPTPAVVVDIDRLEENIRAFQAEANTYGKKLVPMTKTHKSGVIAAMQLQAGAAGLLVGSILEAERFCALHPGSITFAYPFIGGANLERMYAVGRQTQAILSLDSLETAGIYDRFLAQKGVRWRYLLLIDVGLRRFGVAPGDAGGMVREIAARFPRLEFEGISTHPGHVYGALTREQLDACCADEIEHMRRAAQSVTDEGFCCNTVATGSTPTFPSAVKSDVFNVLRPGNYVYFDAIQAALGADIGRCALTVLTTVVSSRANTRWIIDAGSKCFGLDKGAHGASNVSGFGKVLGHDNVTVSSLSEEVGILVSGEPQQIRTGDLLRIIPNHSCSAANMTSYLVAARGDEAIGRIAVDARENSMVPPVGEFHMQE